jgi:hypothetical protein
LKLEAGDDQKVIVHLDNRDPKKDEIVVTSAPVPTNRKSAVQKT